MNKTAYRAVSYSPMNKSNMSLVDDLMNKLWKVCLYL